MISRDRRSVLKPKSSRSRFQAKKSLGQNFLTDPNIIRKILESCQLSQEDTVLEIGPGLGALTRDLSENVKALFAIEKDAALYEKLRAEITSPNTRFVLEDFLKYDLTQLPPATKLIGNIPYNISSPIISKILNERTRFSDVFLTVQFEFAKRLCAQANTKDYSSLSCFTQYFADVRILFKIKNTSFTPSPKVDSCFVHLKPYQALPLKAKNEDLLFKIIRHVFQQRRKTVLKSLSGLFSDRKIGEDALKTIGLETKLRPENLRLKDFVALSDVLSRV